MERTLWTDERMDDTVDRIEKRFDEVDGRFDRLEDEMRAMRREMHNQFLVLTTAILSLAGIMVAHSL
ncbi:MAG: hypothetical protein QOI65_1220 [Thermoleophilaceae bacterium]|nr:hypothetical protein [Thermoleophilaceae bacterium]